MKRCLPKAVGSPESTYDYNWDFTFADSDSASPESPMGDAPILGSEDGTPLLDEMDLNNPLMSEEDTNPVRETPTFNAETNQIELPNGVKINPFGEDGEFDLSIEYSYF